MEMVTTKKVAQDTVVRKEQRDIQQHLHFVGLAHLRSLLTHDEVAGSARRTDVILDMIFILLNESSARGAVQAFCRVREECQDVCYLALFRLRRWMEGHVKVRVNHGQWVGLDLAFKDYRKVVQNYRREFWEWQDSALAENEDVEVRFAWKNDIAVSDVVTQQTFPAAV